jgi:hypothetical protein
METLHTTAYDASISSELKHLQQYPEMMPFIGRNWDKVNHRILLLGESHYIPGNDVTSERKNETHVTDWYNNHSSNFSSYLSNYINTRRVIDIAEKVKENGYKKPLTIYYNLKAAIKEELTALSQEAFIFPLFSFYNYFQRPAFVETASIDNTPTDDSIAYHTLKVIVKVIQPHAIIFVSKKAANSFYGQLKKDDQSAFFRDIRIDNVPHPSCAWWHKKSKACAGQTGREKFIQLLAR